MPDYSSLTPAEKEAKASNTLRAIEERQKEIDGYRKDYEVLTGAAPPVSTGKDLKSRLDAQDDAAALFDRLLKNGKLAELQATDPARFDEICAAAGKANEEKAFQNARAYP